MKTAAGLVSLACLLVGCVTGASRNQGENPGYTGRIYRAGVTPKCAFDILGPVVSFEKGRTGLSAIGTAARSMGGDAVIEAKWGETGAEGTAIRFVDENCKY